MKHPNTNPDRHGNTWEDDGVYLCEISFNYANPIHLCVVRANVVGPTGWCSKTGRPHGEVDLWLWNPMYDMTDRRHSRANPSNIYFLRIVKQLDFTFEKGDGSDGLWLGKTPREML